jgi:hypothetical protein
MKSTILAAVLLAGTALTSLPAQADIVLSDFVFRDLGATGFGNAPRLLSLGNNSLETGGTFYTGTPNTSLNGPGSELQTGFSIGGQGTVVPFSTCDKNGSCNVTGGGTLTQQDKSFVYTIQNLVTLTGGGWVSGAAVGIGLDTNEALGGSPATHDLSFTSLIMTLYKADGSVLGTFAGSPSPPGVDIPVLLLNAQQGNGNSVFDLRLDANQQGIYDDIIGDPLNGGLANIYVGLQASFGCGAFGNAVCNTLHNFESTDGAESFVAFNTLPGPLAGAGLPGLLAACGGMFGLNFWRRRRRGANLPA